MITEDKIIWFSLKEFFTKLKKVLINRPIIYKKIINPLNPNSDNISIYVLCGWVVQEELLSKFFNLYLSSLQATLKFFNPTPVNLLSWKIS